MDCPPNMGIGLICWYKKEPTTSGRTHDHIVHLMIDESIIALVSILYLANLLNAYELHFGGEKNFNNFIDEC